MDDLQVRIDTFADWPKRGEFHNTRELAEAGFYYQPSSVERGSDRLQCAFCPLNVSGWQPGRYPLLVHAIYFPTCFNLMTRKGRCWIRSHTRVNRADSRLINVGTRPNNVLPQLLNDGGNEHRSLTVCVTQKVGQRYVTPNGVPFREPIHSYFSDYQRRLQSLIRFRRETPEFRSEFPLNHFASAGFFWPGHGNFLVCYYCSRGKEIAEVAANDEPFVMHAKMDETCFHLIFEKGEECIHHVASDHMDRFPVEEENLNTGSGTSRNCANCDQVQELDTLMCCVNCERCVCAKEECLVPSCCPVPN